MERVMMRFVLVWCVFILVLVAGACGSLDAEAGASQSSSRAGSDEAEGESSKADFMGDEGDEAEVEDHEIETGEERPHEEDGLSEEEPEVSEREECAVTCFKLTWCNPEGVELAACIEACAKMPQEGIISPRQMECFQEAQTCRDVRRCEEQIESCYEICDSTDACGVVAHGPDCLQWCSGEVWAGRMNWATQGCVVSAGIQNQCGELFECGLRF